MCLSLLWGYLGFVQGIMNGLCWLQLQPVTSHSSSQSMCSTSFEWHIVFWVHNAAILPSHDSKALKTEPEMRKHTGRAGVKVQSALFLLFPFFFWHPARPGQADLHWCVDGGRKEGWEEERQQEKGRERGMHGRGCRTRRSARSLLEPRTGLTRPVCVCVSMCVQTHTHKHIQDEQTHRCHWPSTKHTAMSAPTNTSGSSLKQPSFLCLSLFIMSSLHPKVLIFAHHLTRKLFVALSCCPVCASV